MRSTLFILSMILGGSIAFAMSTPAHAGEDVIVDNFWDKFVCMGAGTCYRDASGDLRKACSGGECSIDRYANSSSGTYNRGAVIITNSGNYVVVPNASGGLYPSAIIRSGGK